MPKAPKQKFYAVKVGREGSKVYTTWDEAKQNVTRYPGAIHKAFHSLAQAEEWLGVPHAGSSGNFHDNPVSQQPLLGVPPTPPNATLSASHSNDMNAEDSAIVFPPINPEPLNPIPVEPPIKLSPEQQEVFDMVKAGRSVFFTGAAGTGKSVLLCEIIKWCRGEGQKQLAVTASTGIASVNIGGQTLHSWAGIGLGKETAEDLVGKILGQDKCRRMKEMEERESRGLPPDPFFVEGNQRNNKPPKVVERWQNAQVLIIDEISMIDGVLFDKLEFIGRVLRRNPKPFGGIQLVLSGDFCQLPPVPDRDSKIPVTFAFDARTWGNCVGRPVTLRTVFRQKEQAFVDILNDMRFGRLSDAAIQTFRELTRPVVYEDELEPTELFPTRDEVETANTTRLNKIQDQAYRYPAVDTTGWDEKGQRIPLAMLPQLLKHLVAPKELTLKVGAQVMLIKNLVQGHLVNGSIGRVVAFSSARDALAKDTRLILADGKMDNTTNGQLLQELFGAPGVPNHRIDINATKSKGGPSEFERSCLKSGKSWPIVRFSNEQEVLCIPAQFEVNNAEGLVQARREQVPLILAWALSIHKSQGQTLERVRVNLGRTFEKGQAYVALSRATSMQRLQILNFDPGKVMAHVRVLEWMRHHGGMPHTEALNAPMDDIEEELAFWGEEW